MKLTWNGHACFSFDTGEGVVVFDPYETNYVRGLRLPPLTGDVVLCSHGHNDHSYATGVKQTRRVPGFTVEVVETCHDAAGGSLRGKSKVHIIDIHGFRLAHLGDLGHILTPEQLAAIGKIDVLLVPVGGVYTLDAQGAKAVCDQIRPRMIFPMHYRHGSMGLEVVDTVDTFLALYDRPAVFLPGHTVELDTAPEGVLVFEAPRQK